jgi:ligand-binding SRPBCC domain-containing protein
MKYDPARWGTKPVPKQVTILRHDVRIERPPSEVFAFCRDGLNFPRMSPHRITPCEDLDETELQLDHVYPFYFWFNRFLKVRLVVHVVGLVPNEELVGMQIRGPMKYFRHTHCFEPENGGTRHRDIVEFATGLGPFLDRTLMRRWLKRTFAERYRRMKQLIEAS